MSAPAARRRRRRGPDHSLLPALAGVVDASTVDAPGHVMVRIAGPLHPDVELGFHSLEPGSHPFDTVAGFEAPEDWTVFGLRTTGRARQVDDPSVPQRRVASTFIVDRHGREASVLRFDEEVLEPPGPAHGVVPDLCRRVLGIPTAPAPLTTAALWTAMWLHRLSERPSPSTWVDVAALHPAVQALAPPDRLAVADPASLSSIARRHSSRTTWHDLRHAPHPLPLPHGPLPIDIARWMDDGFFARWTVGAFPPLDASVTALEGRLRATLGPQVVESLLAVLET